MNARPAPAPDNAADPHAIAVCYPARFVVSVTAIVALAGACVFVPPVAPQNGWWWDMAMAAGLLACGLLFALPVIAPRSWIEFGGDPRALSVVLTLHRDVSYGVLAFSVVHAIGLVVIDPTVVEYLKLSARWPLLAALAATLLLCVLIVSSLFRLALALRYRTWRRWHIALSAVTMGLVLWHVLDAGYYIDTPLLRITFVALAVGPSLLGLVEGRWHAARAVPDARPRGLLAAPRQRAFHLRLLVLLTALWIAAIAIFAIPAPDSRAEREAQCRKMNCISW